MRRVLERLVEPPIRWFSRLGDVVQPPAVAVFHRLTLVRDLLNGKWLGHPAHPAITDLPIGAFVVAFVLDLANQRTAADVAIVVGIIGMVAAALSGLADYADLYGRPRDVGTLHMLTMTVALVLYVVSLAMRLAGPAERTAPIVVSFVGLLLVLFGGFLGGDLVFGLGNMVDRHAWDEGGDEWLPLDVKDVPEGAPLRAMAGADPIVVVCERGEFFALHDVCAHAGGPLSEGRLVDGCIECPWHQSRFRLSDGGVVQGPSVYDQPRFEVRRSAAGALEARRVPEPH